MENQLDRKGMNQSAISTSAWVCVLLALLASLTLAVLILRQTSREYKTAVVMINGETVQEIDLTSIDGTARFTVERDGQTNVIEVRNGGIRIAEANCPDQVCVDQGWLERGSIPIVCLPHRLVIELVEDHSKLLIDAEAG